MSETITTQQSIDIVCANCGHTLDTFFNEKTQTLTVYPCNHCTLAQEEDLNNLEDELTATKAELEYLSSELDWYHNFSPVSYTPGE
jgi:DNA-directed RNA polymerase subunit RPC12/RpoP